MIRVLIVEDSAVQREFLRFILEEAGTFEIVGTAADGEEGVALTEQLRPDIVLMDCHMPKLDGIGATRLIMERCPTPVVIASASSTAGEAALTFDAVKSGALAVVNKPPGITSPDFDRVATELTRTLELMSEIRVVRRWARSAAPAPRPAAPAPTAPPHGADAVRVVAIVGSTGAPGIIAEILAGLAGTAAPPVLIVQHIAEGFVYGLAPWLAKRTGMNVQVAQAGALAEPGSAYLAPDGAHLGIDAAGRIVLAAEPDAEDGFRPSGTFLLRSVAASFGANAIGIVLSGMGRDGVAGLVELQRAGGVTVAQDEDSCVVFGMPREAVAAGAATHVLAPDGIVQLVAAYAGEATPRT